MPNRLKLDKLKPYYPVLILVVLALPALLWWIKSGQIVSTTDLYFPLSPVNALHKSFLSWDPSDLTGTGVLTSAQYNPRFVLLAFSSLLQVLGFSLTMIERVWFFLLILLPGIFTYLFVRELEPKKPIIPLIAGAFVMYNPYMVNMISDHAIIITMIFVPAVLWLILRSVRLKQPVVHGLAIAIMAFIFPSYNPSSYAAGILILVFGFIAIVISQMKDKEALKNLAWLFGVTVVAGLMINSRWLYTTFLGATSGQTLSKPDLAWVTGTTSKASFLRVIRLIGAWDWFDGYVDPYLPFSPAYLKSPIIIVATSLIPIAALWGVIVKRTKLAFGLAVGALVSIVLAMGMHAPMTDFFSWIFTHVPFFWIFRSPWYKFTMPLVFCYSILIGYTVNWLSERWPNSWSPKLKNLPVVIALVVFLITASPLFLGQRFWTSEGRKALGGNRFTLPTYSLDFGRWLKDQPPGRVAAIEQFGFRTSSYTFGDNDLRPYFTDLTDGHGLIYNFFDLATPAFPILRHWNGHFWEPDFPGQTILNVLGARYALSQGDFNYKFFGPAFGFAEADAKLQTLGMPFVKEFGPWKVYENPTAWPNAFISDGVVVLDGLEKLNSLPKEPTAFTMNDTPVKPTRLLKTAPAIATPLTDELNAATVYRYEIPSGTTDRIIVFNQTNDPHWSATLDGKTLEHLPINYYANGFIVPAGLSGKVTVEYLPQRILTQLTILSLGSIFVALLAIIWLSRRRNSN